MKIVTWNINGIRSLDTPLKTILDSFQADVICFQETKITKDLLQSDIAMIEGYDSFFGFSRMRQGYSGVATYCKKAATPFHAQDSFDIFTKIIDDDQENEDAKLISKNRLKELNMEGRIMITQHEYRINSNDVQVQTLTIFNLYCPRADPEKPERLEYKLDFYKALEEQAKYFLKNGSDVIICGDINTSHKPIDHRDPRDPNDFLNNPCRDWMDEFLHNKGVYTNLKANKPSNCKFNEKYIDCFRYVFPKRKDAFTCWCTLTGCRATNYGTRIDYIFGNTSFVCNTLQNCDISPEIYGSDHCPVYASYEINPITSNKCPSICTKYILQHGGKQQNLKKYFSQSASLLKSQNAVIETENKCVANKLKKKVAKNKQTTLTYLVKKPSKPPEKNAQKKSNRFQPYNTENNKPSVKNNNNAALWKKILKGPDPLPKCSGHTEPSVLRTVKKEGPNCGRQFYCCARPEGKPGNIEARCSYFVWKA